MNPGYIERELHEYNKKQLPECWSLFHFDRENFVITKTIGNYENDSIYQARNRRSFIANTMNQW